MAYQVEVKKEDKEKAVKTRLPVNPIRVIFVYPDGAVKVIKVKEFHAYPDSYEIVGEVNE